MNRRFDRMLIPPAAVLTESLAFAASFLMFPIAMAFYGVGPTLALLWLPVVVAATLLLALGVAWPAALLGLWAAERHRCSPARPLRVLFFAAPGLVALSEVRRERPRLDRLQPAHRAVRVLPARLSLRQRARVLGARLSRPRVGLVLMARVPPALPPRAAPLREAGDDVMSAVRAEGVGIQYLFDRQQRTVSPTLVPRCAARGGDTWALRDVSFAMVRARGSRCSGASGSGKSTLLRTIAGVLEPDTGRLASPGPGRLAALRTGRRHGDAHRAGEHAAARRARGHDARVRRGRRWRTVKAAQRPRQELRAPRRRATRRACARAWASRSSSARSRRSCCSTRSTRRSTTSSATTSSAYARELIERRRHRRRDRPRPPDARAPCTRALLLRDGHLVADGDFRDVQREYLGDRAGSRGARGDRARGAARPRSARLAALDGAGVALVAAAAARLARRARGRRRPSRRAVDRWVALSGLLEPFGFVESPGGPDRHLVAYDEPAARWIWLHFQAELRLAGGSRGRPARCSPASGDELPEPRAEWLLWILLLRALVDKGALPVRHRAG